MAKKRASTDSQRARPQVKQDHPARAAGDQSTEKPEKHGNEDLPDLYQDHLLVEHMQQALALHEIICDEQGKPVDYRFISINKQFEEFSGLKKDNILDRTVLDVLPDTEAFWIETYGKVALSGEPYAFEHYSGSLDKWYSVSAYCPKPGFFATIFTDITKTRRLMEALSERELFLKTILKTSRDGFWIVNAGGQLSEVNQAYCKMSGFSERELLQMRLTDLETGASSEEIIARLKRVCEAGSDFYEAVHRRKDGSLFHVEMSLSCIHQEPFLVACFCRDTTERKKSQIHMQDALGRLRSLMQHSPSPIILFDENGQYVEVSQSAADMLGLPAREIIGKNFSQLLEPAVAAEFMRTTHELKENVQPIIKLDHIDLDDRPSILESRLFYVGRTADNRMLFGSIINDITERHEMARLLKNEKEMFQTTLLSVADAVISTDQDLRIVVMNQVAQQLTGWSFDEAAGRPIDEVLIVADECSGKPCPDPARTVLESGQPLETGTQTVVLCRNGDRIPIEHSAAPIRDGEGGTRGVVIVFRDYTEKRLQQREIEYLSFHDHLTGLYNRRYMDDAVARLDTARNLPLSIMVIDVNGLKLTNDAFGHEAGDNLLSEVSKVLKSVCRADDIIARMGGDEFHILLPHTGRREAEQIRERINQAAASVRLSSVILSLAIGYDTKTEPEQEIASVITSADNDMYRSKLQKSKTMRTLTIQKVLENINQKYDQEKIHTERVSQYCEFIARAMKLNSDEITDLKTISILHDIGKITISPELLRRADPLSDEEFAIIRRHPETGYQILKGVDEYAALAEMVLYHHERWDGDGYPEGLKGESIPLQSRIMAVAEAFECMTADRPYKKAMSTDEALNELLRCAGSQFDPAVVRIFVNTFRTT